MKALLGHDFDALADEADTAEFCRGFAGLNADHRRILTILLPRLVALQERGDSSAALNLIAEIKLTLIGEEAALH